jgi:phage antirepressor YoqD-like protein
MSNITVQNINSELVVDSRLIAQELWITHHTLKGTIRNYSKDLEEFGNLGCTTAGVQGTSSYETFYYLNEDQANLLVTYSNNTEQVRAAKIHIIKAFKAAKQALIQAAPKLPTTYLDALKELVASEEQKQLLEQEVKVLTPKAEVYDKIAVSKNNISVGEAAKILGTGQNKLFEKLRDEQILMQNNLPYQQYINQGYFDVVVKTKNNLVFSTTVVTPKGLTWLAKH